MIYFFLISFLSLITQTQLKNILGINSNIDRYIISGFLFFFFYILLEEYLLKPEKVGIAIHLNKLNDIAEIFSRVGNYPDFIHVDLIDKSINDKNISTDLKILDEILNYWPEKDTQLHLMSINHEFWINQLEEYSNTLKIFVHDDNGEKIKYLQDKFSNFNISLVITKNSNFENNLLAGVEEIICLCVDKPSILDKFIKNQWMKLYKNISI